MAFRLRHLLVLICLCAFAGAPHAGGVLDRLDQLSNGERHPQREFLPPEQAFVFTHSKQADGVRLRWEIAPGYYLYRDRMQFEALTAGVEIGVPVRPPSEAKDDAEFGRVEIYHGTTVIDLPLTLAAGSSDPKIRVTYQGCAEDGICYPPIKREIPLGDAAGGGPRAAAAGDASATERLAGSLGKQGLFGTVGWFFLAGLALAFTPCVFPMVPILSGIIVGQHGPPTALRSFGLSVVYVFAMAATYAGLGVAAGMLGRNLQAAFQHPAVLVGFSGVFVLLALAMFGFVHLQVPSFVQRRLDPTSRGAAGGRLFGVGIMGALSAVLVGPCVAPPLAAALLYLGRQGNPLVGGAALFALGLGMGAPLLVLGASAGRLLPRAGAWMETVKQAFGVVFLGLAIWFLERLLPPAATLALWAVLLIGSAIYLGALEPLRDAATGWQRFWKGIGLVLLCYGIVLLVGAAAGAEDPMRPLAPLAAGRVAEAAPVTAFEPVKGSAGLDLAIAAAKAQGKGVVVDFYADWCIECKRLERNTFNDPAVQSGLRGFVLLRADVTDGDATDQALLRRFELMGPPAVLFFDRDGREQRAQRLIGYAGPGEFEGLLAVVAAQ